MDQENVLIILFHEILLPGVLFKGAWIGPQFIQLGFGGSDLLLVVLFAFFQLSELFFMPEMGSNKISVINKQYPYGKARRC